MHPIQQSPTRITRSVIPVAIYTRVSTLHQVGGRFDSCESQAAICRDFIRKHAHEGWFEYACHTDAAYSGGTMNRPGLQALYRQIEAGEVKIVLIFKFERMLRNTDEWSPFRSFLAKHECRLVSTTEDLSEETPSGRLKNNLLVSVAEYERLNTAEKVRAKLGELAKRGIWNCGLVPFGYNYDAAEKKLHPHPTEGSVVRRIFEQAAQLVTLTAIANALNADGVRTRDRIFKRRDGRQASVGGRQIKSDWLRALVRNPIHSGRVRLKGQDYPGQHEALVSRELWERANAAVETAVKPARCRLQARDKHCHILKGLVRCAHCGRAMVPNACGKRDREGKLYRYYTCGHAHQEQGECPVRHVSANLLELTVVEFVGALARHPEIVREALAASSTHRKTDRNETHHRLEAVDRSLADVDNHLKRIVDAITADAVAVLGDELRERAAGLKAEKQRLLVERETLRQAQLECTGNRLDADRFLAAIARFAEVFPNLTPSEQKDLVALCFSRIELRAGAAGEDCPGLRQYQLRLKLHLERLTDGMEERVLVERQRGQNPSSTDAPLVLEPKVVFRSMGRTPMAVIVAPFREEFRDKRSLPAPSAEPATGTHPLHRAIAWDRKLRTTPGLTQAGLARTEGITPATLTYHLKLLGLAPEIRKFLLGVNSSEDLRRFSLRRMMALASLDIRRQREAFAQLKTA